MSSTADIIAELAALDQSDEGPFPYSGCRALLAKAGVQSSSLIPDVDSYLSELAGYRSWKDGILSWPDAKINDVLLRLTVPFFERFPEHKAYELGAMEGLLAPDLQVAFERAEKTRQVLVELLRKLQSQRRSVNESP